MGYMTRAIAKLAAAQQTGEPVDPNDPDIVRCRLYGEMEAKGQIGPDYNHELMSLREGGVCTCGAKPERSEFGAGIFSHPPTDVRVNHVARTRAGRAAGTR